MRRAGEPTFCFMYGDVRFGVADSPDQRNGSGRAGHRRHALPDGRWAHCRGMDVRHSHGLRKQLGMLPTPATGSVTGGGPADDTAR